MRIAFQLIGGKGWTGGINYLSNILSALTDLNDESIEPVFFVGNDVSDDELKQIAQYLKIEPIRSELLTRGSIRRIVRIFCSLFLQRDYLFEKILNKNGIDVVFQHSDWFGLRFKIPTLAWIADFQHRHLPDMFSRFNYWKREIGYRALSRSATTILVSSNDCKCDCENFYPKSKNKIRVLQFVVKTNAKIFNCDTELTRRKYNLPPRFMFLPNQFWKHKNHISVIKALGLIKERGQSVVVAVSGNINDVRNPDYPREILSIVKELKLESEFRILGLIPYEDIGPLMRVSVAVVNPSFFEGWSTTVEEAKAIGVPLLLSDIRVHREQSPSVCRFFNPYDVTDIANIIVSAWEEWTSGPH